MKVHSRKNHLVDERLKSFAPGMKIQAIDAQILKQYELQNLSQLLTQQVPVFIKSYGINSLATLNFRGSSSAQSQVLWNGIPLNSASSGITDLSMLSVNSFDQINIAYGGSSALLGSGNVGAALLLDNNFSIKDSSLKWLTKIGSEIGSFGQYKFSAQEQFSSTKLYVALKIMHQESKNNFGYTYNLGQWRKLENAQMSSNNMMLNIGYLLNKHTTFKFSVWYQHFDRAIPPALFEKISFKNQQDQSIRLFSELHHINNKGNKRYSKTAFLNDNMWYKDDAISLNTSNKIYQFYQEFGWKTSCNKNSELLLFTPISISWTIPQNDTLVRYQNKMAIAAAYQYSLFQNKLLLAANARLEQINHQTILLPGVNASYSIHQFLKLRANIQRSFRAPSLNEWYYQPGGNLNLKPEKGWSTDAGYELKIPINKYLLLHHDLSVFNRKINDWILWFGGSIWTPHNIARVYSRGVESINTIHWGNGKINAEIGLNTSFVLATTQASYIPNDGSIGKQIPYSPRYNNQVNAAFHFKKFDFRYNHTYVGYRFTTTDESDFLPPYQTANAYLSFSHHLKAYQWKLSLQCNNIWNQEYQVINQRPMPLRHWAAGLSLSR